MRPVRTSAKAIIIRDGHLLAIRNRDAAGNWYLLPGGGQHLNEPLHQTLMREFDEEVGGRISIGPLRLVRDYISNHHEFAHEDKDFHQVEFYFECELLGEIDGTPGHEPDAYQHGVEWLSIDRLETFRLYPKVFQTLFQDADWRSRSVYLGDVN